MYGSPAAAAKDLNLPFSAAAVGFGHRREESDLQRQQQQMSSGLLRYRSAPSALLGEVCEDFLPVRPSSPETESMFARFLASDLREDKPSGGGLRNPVFMPPPVEQSSGFSSASSQMLYLSQHQHQHQHQPPPPASENAYRGVSSMAMEAEQMKPGGCTNLIRQSSSPAGLFSHLNVNCGYGLMRGMAASIRNGRVAEAAVGRLKGQISLSSRQNSLSQISELGSEDISGGGGSPDESSNGHCVVPGYAVSAWEDSLISNSFSGAGAGGGGLKRTASDVVGLNQTGLRNGELRNHRATGFAHQISLPKCPSELPALDKFLHFHDSVPCKIRAKRGCATHPRSIAERVRRTRISERMRKLQELVPNMDKQTNTADMLDLAVDYIKDLQRQVKSLSDSRTSCICSTSNERLYQNKAC